MSDTNTDQSLAENQRLDALEVEADPAQTPAALVTATAPEVEPEADDARQEEAEADQATNVPEADEESGDEESSEEKANGSASRGMSATAERLENEGDIAADYLEELLDIADLDGDIDTYVEGGRAHVSIVTEGEKLVGKDGVVLDALQELARLAVMTETGHRSRLMLDIAGHRDRRRAELTTLAKDAIAEVKNTGEQARLAPMNPFERKIIHDIVAEAGLVSESEGEEPRRRVVILPN